MPKITAKRIRLKVLRDLKHIRQEVFSRREDNKKIIFILGCQRSGTTMLSKIFDKDRNIRVFPEKNPMTNLSPPEYLNFNPFSEVKEFLSNKKAPSFVLKPLVESQNATKLLDYFENSKVIWAYRHYKDVASSNLKKFDSKNGINDLRPIANDEPENWRSDNVSNETRNLVKKYFSEDMSEADAAALFWYCRNILYFEQNLQRHQNVRLCKYEYLVTKPKQIMTELYAFTNLGNLKMGILSDVHPGSISKGKDLGLSAEISKLCEDLHNKLDSINENQRSCNNINTPPIGSFGKESNFNKK